VQPPVLPGAWLGPPAGGGADGRSGPRSAEAGTTRRDHTVVDTQPAGFDVHCMKHSHNNCCYSITLRRSHT
jgi:hypothetical protein